MYLTLLEVETSRRVNFKSFESNAVFMYFIAFLKEFYRVLNILHWFRVAVYKIFKFGFFTTNRKSVHRRIFKRVLHRYK